jgi:UDP-N-acetylmuramoyl-tripeptide--D-alanyl-D-alanine ligase
MRRRAAIGWRLRAFLRPVSESGLYALAFVWRRLLVGTTFVAITGSLGKTTTTKECLAGVLAAHGPTYRGWRSQNSNAGVVLNVLRVRPWHRYAVLELAAAAPGTMRKKARLVVPDVAVLLPVTATHTQAFRDLDEHAAEKEVLLEWLRVDGLAILSADDARVARMAARTTCRVIFAGVSANADVRADDISSAWPDRLTCRVHHGGEIQRVETQLVGAHWVPAVVSAVAAATALGMALPDVARVLRSVPPFPGRMQPIRLPNGAVVLRDDYNAAVEGMVRALEALEHARARRRVVVFTDISDFEGNRRRRLQFLAPLVARAAESVVIVGPDAAEGARRVVAAGMRRDQAHGFALLTEAAEFLRQDLGEGDLVLVKGRTTDHATRLVLAQFGTVRCWKSYCAKRALCDVCWELGLSDAELAAIPVVAPGKG